MVRDTCPDMIFRTFRIQICSLSDSRISRISLPDNINNISAEDASTVISQSESAPLDLSKTDLHSIPVDTRVVIETVEYAIYTLSLSPVNR